MADNKGNEKEAGNNKEKRIKINELMGREVPPASYELSLKPACQLNEKK